MRQGAVTEESLKKSALVFFGQVVEEMNKRTLASKLKELKRDSDNGYLLLYIAILLLFCHSGRIFNEW